MTAKDLRSPLLDVLREKTQNPNLPIARVRSDAAVGYIVLPADEKNRVVLDVDGVRRVVHVGKLDLLTPGKVIIIEGERGIITSIKKETDGIMIEAIYGTVTMASSAKDIEGMPR